MRSTDFLGRKCGFVVFFALNVLVSNAVFAENASCNTKFQVRHFQPQVCYSEYNAQSCVDVCSTATPAIKSECFREMPLPCEVVDSMRSTARGFQTEGSESWFHISDLISYRGLYTDLGIFQVPLYKELYNDFISTPGEFGFSPASDELRRQNFRLDLLSRIERQADSLRYAAVYRRYSLGLELEEQLNQTLLNMFSQVDNYPYFSSAQKKSLKTELSESSSRQQRLWNILKRYSLDTIATSRLGKLNSRMSTFAKHVGQLPADLQETILHKAQILNQYVDVSLASCDSGICFNTVKASQETPFYPNFDNRLTYFEQTLLQLSDEAAALTYVYDGDYQLTPPGQSRVVNLAGFVSDKFSDFRAHRTESSLERLATAINIAYLTGSQRSKETLNHLTEIADVKSNAGLTTLATLDNKPILLCKEFNKLSPEMAKITSDSHELAKTIKEMIYRLDEDDSETLIYVIQEKLAQLSRLTVRSQAIANVELFAEDRILTINWELFDPSVINTSDLLIEVEYLDYDGMFWTPRMSSNLSEVFPSIDVLGTMTNSLLPIGVGMNSPLNNLKLRIKQSAFHACAESNQQVNMVVKITDQQGIVSRQVLTATLEQI
ncbi:hypothetical protein ACSLBF_17785 (plasmid) [Pseudoalteromonas sp. T1lg65]|uniref:hypothetical protein n=1 Tax=Pseudoalteromonas sp. T1lg65 TaxID=2077101 RepID=UPI003F7ABCB7